MVDMNRNQDMWVDETGIRLILSSEAQRFLDKFRDKDLEIKIVLKGK